MRLCHTAYKINLTKCVLSYNRESNAVFKTNILLIKMLAAAYSECIK